MMDMGIKQDLLFPNLPERLTGLGELTMNLWWSWNPARLGQGYEGIHKE
jgi:hypothetical protein